MRSAAAHVSARQSTSNQLAIIDINKVISIVNVHQNEKQRNVPLIENKNRYRGFVKNVMRHVNCLKIVLSFRGIISRFKKDYFNPVFDITRVNDILREDPKIIS